MQKQQARFFVCDDCGEKMERGQHCDELCEDALTILTRVNNGDDSVDWRLLKKAIKTLWVDRRVFDDNGKSPLTLVCELGFKEGVELLLLLGANVTEFDERAISPLVAACGGGHISLAQWLVEQGADIDPHGDENADAALIEACRGGHLGMATWLIERGANVNAATGFGNTALIAACSEGHDDVARWLLDQGADMLRVVGGRKGK